MRKVRARAEDAAEERVLDVLVGFQDKAAEENVTRQKFRKNHDPYY